MNIILFLVVGLSLSNLLFIIIGIISMRRRNIPNSDILTFKGIIPYYKSYYHLIKYKVNLHIKYYDKVTITKYDFVFDRDMPLRIDNNKFYLILNDSIIEYDYNFNEVKKIVIPQVGGFIFLIIKNISKKCSNVVKVDVSLTDDEFRKIIAIYKRDQQLSKII